MSYRCSICEAVSPPGESRLLYVVKRADGNVDRELPVCRDCLRELATKPLADVVNAHRPPPVAPPETPVKAPRPLKTEPLPLPLPVESEAPLPSLFGDPVSLGVARKRK